MKPASCGRQKTSCERQRDNFCVLKDSSKYISRLQAATLKFNSWGSFKSRIVMTPPAESDSLTVLRKNRFRKNNLRIIYHIRTIGHGTFEFIYAVI